MSRRAVVGSGAALAATGGAAYGQASDSLAQDVATYVGFGEHRCGTLAESRTVEWLRGRLLAEDYAVRRASFPIDTVIDPDGWLRAGNLEVPAFPQWLTPTHGLGRPIDGRLRPLPSAEQGSIAYVEQPFRLNAYWQSDQQAAAIAARSAGAGALIIAMDDPTDGIYVCNQEAEVDLPVPVGIVNRSGLATVKALGRQGAPVELQLTGHRRRSKGFYLAAHKPGIGGAIVISTPLTGWFRCGAERGPGIGLMLRLARTLTRSPRPIWLLATGGHELGHLGMKQALASGALPKPDETALWIHLGAGIGAQALDDTYKVKSPQALTVHAELEPLITGLFPPQAWSRLSPSPKSPGEAGDVVGAGYHRILGVLGGFPGFHTPGDDGRAVDFKTLAKIGDDLAGLALGL